MIVWRFTLREGVTFHNGEPWNAEAAKASFDVLADAELASSLGKVSFVSLFASGMEIVDEMTVDLTTNVPDTEFLGLYMRLGYVGLPPQFVAENGLEALSEQPIGTGPYAFTSWSRGQRVVLERYDGYWEPEVQHWAGVEFITRPEASVRAQTVRAGEAHFAFNIGAEQAKTLSKSIAAGGFQSSSIRLNNTIAPTSDQRVREAINLALDRQAIVDAIFDGTADPLSFFAYQPIDLEPYPYDPDAAAALIEEAGFTGTEVEMVYGENRIPEEVQLAEIYTASLEAIGLRVQLTRLEPQQYNDVGGLPFEEQPALFMETTSSGNYGDVVGALRDKYGCQGSGTYCNPEIEADWAELSTLTGEERAALIQEIAERLHADAPRAWVAGVRQVHGLADFLEPDLPLNAYILLDDVKPA